jgi:hypothetical protein
VVGNGSQASALPPAPRLWLTGFFKERADKRPASNRKIACKEDAPWRPGSGGIVLRREAPEGTRL